MTSRRSFLKALALAAGGATIASEAVSAILTLPARKNEPQRAPDTQNGHRPAYLDADYEQWYLIHPDAVEYHDMMTAHFDEHRRRIDRERIWNLHKYLPPYTEEELMRP